MSFDGSFKTTKRVALGGASKERGDRASLLDSARRDREHRSRRRLETRAASLVQACWRSSRALSAARHSAREKWLRAYGASAGEWSENILADGDKKAQKFHSELLFFAKPRSIEDVILMARACFYLLGRRAVLGGAHPGHPGVLRASGVPGSETHAILTLRGRKTVLFALEALACSNCSELSEEDAYKLVTSVLTITNMGAWSITWGGPVPPEKDPVLIVKALLSTLCVRDRFAKRLRAAFAARQSCPATHELLQVLWPRILESNADLNCAFENTCAVQIASLPRCWREGGVGFGVDPKNTWMGTCETLRRHLTAQNAATDDNVFTFPDPPSSGDPDAVGHDGHGDGWVLGNLVEGADAGLAACGGARVGEEVISEKHVAVISFLEVASLLLKRLPDGTAVAPARHIGADSSMQVDGSDDEVFSDDDDDGDDDSDDDDGTRKRSFNSRQKGSDTNPRQPTLAPECLSQIGKALDASFLKRIINASLVECVGTTPQTTELAKTNATRVVSEFLGNLLSRLNMTDRNSLLSTIAFGTPFIVKAWDVYGRFCVTKRWPTAGTAGAAGATTSPKHTAAPNSWWIASLGLFASAYGTFLLTGDDEEFTVRGRPLPVTEIGNVICTLRDALWWQLWVSDSFTNIDDGAFSVDACKARVATTKSLARALQQVHDRNGRLKLVHPSLFHAPSLFSTRALGGAGHVAADGFLSEAASDLGYDGATKRGKGRSTQNRAADLLRRAPALVPFDVRVRWFTEGLRRDRMENVGAGSAAEALGLRAEHSIVVTRGSIFSDAMSQLGPCVFKQDMLQWRIANPAERPPGSLKGVIRVRFLNKHGVEEPGVDGGGLFKDFLSALMAEAFDPESGGLFVETPTRTLYPNPASELAVGATHLRKLEFLGAVLGKAVYEQILVDVPLAGFFLSKLRDGRPPELNDLSSLDPELYHHLLSLKGMPAADVEALGLDFTVTDKTKYLQETQTGDASAVCELLPGGSSISVNGANRTTYVHLVAHHLLHRQIARQSNAFCQGFRSLVPPAMLRVFAPSELRLLIAGAGGKIDVTDLAASVVYSGGYDAHHDSVKMLWDVLENDFSVDDQRAFLKFVTACPNTPLLGFNQLVPRFCVHRSGMTGGSNSSEGNADLNRLPTAATCMNMLKLPPYKNKLVFTEKLRMAINSESGFDLS